MGLDMYLYRKEYVSTFAWTQDEKAVKEANLHSVIANHFNIDPNMGGIYVDYCVAYWRKANAIQGWFVTCEVLMPRHSPEIAIALALCWKILSPWS